MTELLPCPFCGGEAHVIPQMDGISGTVKYSVYCDSRCGVVAFYCDTEAEAIDAWNTRAAMEFDNWFYLPKPKEPVVEVEETTYAWDGTKVRTDVFYQVHEQIIDNWANELDEHIIKRICEVWNTRAERTCTNVEKIFPEDEFDCSECGYEGAYELYIPNYCPNCGARVIGVGE
ncbi:MAG: Lar family restriction alleviation protein [Eggerthellaceae bacterium]|nr:Lar family restriction alleviation protein [Eggerthellaceae bacterium]MBQ3342702.1 Lar family restriction alleviation protein [Kiritimatiellia bacterium]